MMCALTAARRGRSVLLIDHAKKPGEKIRISGGGRCNFTNLSVGPHNFISGNPRFARDVLKVFRPRDFIAMVDARGIAWHEKTLGQLFCDGSSQQIIDMLTDAMDEAGAELQLATAVEEVSRDGDFRLRLSTGKTVRAERLVIATGGKSIPKIGATDFGYRIAWQFGLPVTETRAALVPLTFGEDILSWSKGLAGVSLDAQVACGKTKFEEGLLFTHRGLSGPSILQISSYWREGEAIRVNAAKGLDVAAWLKEARQTRTRQAPQTVLADLLPKGLVSVIADEIALPATMADLSNKAINTLTDRIQNWQVQPMGSEGYRTAEVTLGGVETGALEAKSMEAREVPGLHFIGEVVDVTGWLGGYNFQWAWASGYVAGNAV